MNDQQNAVARPSLEGVVAVDNWFVERYVVDISLLRELKYLRHNRHRSRDRRGSGTTGRLCGDTRHERGQPFDVL